MEREARMVEYVNVVEVVATMKALKSFAIETGRVPSPNRWLE